MKNKPIMLNRENADAFLHDHEHTASRALQRLNRSKIKNRIVGTMTSEEALKNLGPMSWSEDVLSGKRKITVSEYSEKAEK